MGGIPKRFGLPAVLGFVEFGAWLWLLVIGPILAMDSYTLSNRAHYVPATFLVSRVRESLGEEGHSIWLEGTVGGMAETMAEFPGSSETDRSLAALTSMYPAGTRLPVAYNRHVKWWTLSSGRLRVLPAAPQYWDAMQARRDVQLRWLPVPVGILVLLKVLAFASRLGRAYSHPDGRIVEPAHRR